MPNNKELADYRQEIDAIDEEIVRLLNERAKSVIEIGKLKKEADANANLHKAGREAQIIERLTKLTAGPFPAEGIRSVYREIMSASLALEAPQKVAYLGPRATFTHMACTQKFGSAVQYLPAHSIKEVFQEVERGRANFGVVPVENTTEGVVNHTLDMFLDSDLLIYGEILQEVSHNLLSQSGNRSEVRIISSHPQALAQCRNWLQANLPHVPTVEAASTARAAEMCIDDPAVAAVASELAGQIYGLKAIKERIEDNPNNATRFLVLSRKPCERTANDKTALMLSMRDKVGALYDLLRPFAAHGVNMTKIESRPSQRKAWEYVFFVDVEGNIDDDKVRAAVDEIRPSCVLLKVLGSFPAHR